jgi:hypothetical protein
MLWNQDGFNAAIKEYLATIKGPKIPRALNKKAFFVALRAQGETPKKEAFAISTEVARVIIARRKDGSTGPVPLLWVIAAIRVGKTWAGQKMVLGEKNKRRVNIQKAYLRALAKKSDTILGSRKRSAGFLRVGWLSVIKELGPLVGYQRGNAPAPDSSVKQVGVMKGSVQPAAPGDRPSCTIINSAQSRSDRANGLIRFGAPALDRAFALETKDTNEYLEGEVLREAARRFNEQQK